ncbi:MAG: DUF1311 domain-containing protein [Cyclobacteriaceae bacterium]|nr:DUF1311 domain-containing protein [Cyclobacteriaceae bacterium]
MKKNLLTVLLLLLSVGITQAQTREKAQTQDAETKEAINAFKTVDAELNAVFSKILTQYKSDTEFIKNVKEAQELWLKFRAAEVKAKFPDRTPGTYASGHTICVNDYLTELTVSRIVTLKIWLNGTYEGDICSGSVKIN